MKNLNSNYFNIAIPFFLIGFFFLPGQTIVLAEEIPSPTIAIYPDIYYPLDEVIYLEGRARPNSSVQINFQKQGIKPLNLNTKSDGRGEWVLIEKVPLEAGNWEVRVRIIESTGITSKWSNPRALEAIVTGVVIGGVTIKFAFLLFLLFTVIVVSSILILYFFFRMKRVVRDKEMQAMGAVVERNFTKLRRNTFDELEHLEQKLKRFEKLTEEEEGHRTRLLREFREAEDEIEDKMKDL